MKGYDLTPQERNNFCVCSLLQAVFRKYGLKYTQEQIASKLTPSEKGFHIDDLIFSSFMRFNGFDYTFFEYNQTPFNEPDTLLDDMNLNHGIIGINSHSFLLSNFRYPKLELIDPKDGILLNRNLYELMEEMRNLYGGFGLIRYMGGGQLHLRV